MDIQFNQQWKRDAALALLCIFVTTILIVLLRYRKQGRGIKDIAVSLFYTLNSAVWWCIWSAPIHVTLFVIRTVYYITVISASIVIAARISTTDFEPLKKAIQYASDGTIR